MTESTAKQRYSVCVLGPLAVARGGEVLDLGGPKQRLVLAMLLSDLDRVVSSSRLIDGLWGEEPPATARKALQMRVSNLRRSLGEAFPLRTAGGGYLVQSAELDYDAAAFSESVARATALLRTDPAGAANLLSAALAAWRGPAFADLDDEAAIGSEIARLNELRLAALEWRIDADLRLGRHAESVGEIEALTVDYPFRERFREQHMLALYRAGRQTEALRAYDHTRATLIEELGIEPSPSMQALHAQILQHASELEYVSQPGDATLAFLATDLENSTSLWESDPDAMQSALTRHDELLATAVENNAGTVFKGTGDGVYAVFASAVDAIQAGIDAQVALAAQAWPTDGPLRVRMAVDEGPASARDGDYFGPALNRVSRIMSAGHGGQLLVPAALGPHSPFPVRELGVADFKGVGRIEVVQVEVPGLNSEFPGLRTDRAPKGVPREGFGRAIRGYELREQLGIGASGIVFRAYQASIGREVAIKVIRPELANRSGFVKRFEAEAQFIAQLEHPHIVPLYDYWRDPDGAYLVMQLLRGGSLADSLQRSPWRAAPGLHLLEQVGAALDSAHRHGVLHRDLKPANVLLDGEGNAFLSDFGIATDHVDAIDLPTESSVAYVSPEELAGQPVTSAADIYGFTLLAYETLTGARPEPGDQPDPVARTRPDLPVALDRVIERGAHPDPSRRYARVTDFLRDLRQAFGADVVNAPTDDTSVEVRNPFKGLRAFKETDAEDFFGRDEVVTELVEHVARHRFTAVVGPSGSGKSSVVRAGLLPATRRGALGVDGNVLITEMFPGSYPFEELESALLRVAVAPMSDTMSDLLGDERGLLRVSKQILPDDDCRLILVVDQFEELFSLTTDLEVRKLFLASLVEVARDERSRVRIVATMRADYFDRPLEHAEFGDVLRDGLFPIAAPREHELAAAIVQPARRAGLEFEPGLVARIVRDVADQPGALPLLQYALTALVDERCGRVLDTADYERVGGVAGALATRADEIFRGLSPAAQDATRKVFVRLVRVDDHSEDTRRRAGRRELDALESTEGGVDVAIAAFGTARLLAFDRDPVSRGQTVEVAHEALIREWPRYRDWIAERRDSLLVERRLESAVSEWDGAGRPNDLLMSGPRLQQFEQWAADDAAVVPPPMAEFLRESRAGTNEAERRRSALRHRVMSLVAVLAVVASVAAVVAWVQRGRARDQEQVAVAAADEATVAAAEAAAAAAEAAAAAHEERAATADAESLRAVAEVRAVAESAQRLGLRAVELADDDPDLAVLLAVESARRALQSHADLSASMQALFTTTMRHRVADRFEAWDVQRVSESIVSAEPTGDRMAVVVSSGPDERRVEIIGRADDRRVVVAVERPTSVAWHPTDDVVAVGDVDQLGGVDTTGVIWLVDPSTGATLRRLAPEADGVVVLQFTSNRILYKVDDSLFPGLGTAKVADSASGDVVLTSPWATTYAELSPSGLHVLFVGVGGAAVHSTVDGAVIWQYPVGNVDRRQLDWAPGSDRLYWATTAGELRTVDMATLDETVVEFPAERIRFPTAIAASPDGRWLAVGGFNGTIGIYDAATLDPAMRIPGHVDTVTALDWVPGRGELVSLGADREIIVSDVMSPPATPSAVWAGSGGFPLTHIVGDSGDLVAAVRNPKDIMVESVEMWTSDSSSSIPGRPDDVRGGVLGTSGAGRSIVAEPSANGFVVRDVRTGDVVADVATDATRPLAISPRGGTAVAAVGDADLFLSWDTATPRVAAYDIATGRELWQLDGVRSASKTGTGSPAAFLPDGDILIMATSNPWGLVGYDRPDELLAIDSQTGAVLGRHPLGSSDVNVAVSPTGDRVVLADDTGEVVVLDVDRLLAGGPEVEVASTTLASGQLSNGLAFSDDGATVYTPAGFLTSELLALDVDAGLAVRWSIDLDVLDAGLAGSRPVVRDGRVWIAVHDLPTRASDPGVPTFGLVGIPEDISEYADWASELPTRDFTEMECNQYLGGACVVAAVED